MVRNRHLGTLERKYFETSGRFAGRHCGSREIGCAAASASSERDRESSALHLPTLARLAERFAVVHVSDGGSGGAAALAARTGARTRPGIDDLLADPRVEIVAICSPPHLHAAQVRAAVAAGKRAILCEKPLAHDARRGASAVIEACRACRHRADRRHQPPVRPGVGAARSTISSRHGGRVRTIIGHGRTAAEHALPRRRHRARARRRAPVAARPDWADPEVAASVVRQLIVGPRRPRPADRARSRAAARARSSMRARSRRSATRSGSSPAACWCS